MNTMNPRVDRVFFSKPLKWQAELEQLREILLDCGLTEELKWEQPCYTFEKNNIAIIGELKDCCILSFFKGALLNDAKGILTKPGENTQAGRVIRFTDIQKIVELQSVLEAYIYEAVEIEKAGLKVDFKSISEHTIPEEFQNKLNENLNLKTAFEALTPGRQRAYLLHFSQPKQSKTRESRIEKCAPQILDGKGLYD